MLTKEQVIKLLEENDRAVGRALLVLLGNQTADEQAAETVRWHNAMGFRPCHARVGTNMANFFRSRGYLTPKQANWWRKRDRSGAMRIGIYSRQLLEAAAVRSCESGTAEGAR